MNKLNQQENLLIRLIETHVFFIRGRRVMLSTHLADIYGIEHRVLIQAVKRNKIRFPNWFIFQLNAFEFNVLKSQFVISKYNHIRRSLPYALTEQGVVVLSGILRSKSAMAMSAVIIKNFVKPHRSYLKAHSIASELW